MLLRVRRWVAQNREPLLWVSLVVGTPAAYSLYIEQEHKQARKDIQWNAKFRPQSIGK
jgi:hypothetical protein